MTRALVILTSPADRAKACEWCGQPFTRDTRYSRAYFARQRFCSAQCFGSKHADEAQRKRPSMQDAFAKWFDTPETGCWEWTGARDRDGYGIFSYARKSMRAPVVALTLDGRTPPKGAYACHHCDNPACVRPSHLYPGSPTDNSRDARKRGRVARGERQHMAKLTDDAVREIRSGGATDEDFATRFGVSRSAVTMARIGTTWKHVQ